MNERLDCEGSSKGSIYIHEEGTGNEIRQGVIDRVSGRVSGRVGVRVEVVQGDTQGDMQYNGSRLHTPPDLTV